MKRKEQNRIRIPQKICPKVLSSREIRFRLDRQEERNGQQERMPGFSHGSVNICLHSQTQSPTKTTKKSGCVPHLLLLSKNIQTRSLSGLVSLEASQEHDSKTFVGNSKDHILCTYCISRYSTCLFKILYYYITFTFVSCVLLSPSNNNLIQKFLKVDFMLLF